MAGRRPWWPNAAKIAAQTGARLTLTADVAEGVNGSDYLYTDVWVSMGEPDSVWAERVNLLKPYQVNTQAMALDRQSRMPSSCTACPPSTIRDTEVGKEMEEKFGLEQGMEVTEEVFESPASIVFDEAENSITHHQSHHGGHTWVIDWMQPGIGDQGRKLSLYSPWIPDLAEEPLTDPH